MTRLLPPPEPPHSLDAERAVLGAILVNNEAFDRVRFLEPADFFAAQHGRIFAACRLTIESGRIADPVTLARQFDHDEEIPEGQRYLAALCTAAQTILYAEDYGQHIRELRRKRELAARLEDARAHALNGAGPDAVLAEVRALVVADERHQLREPVKLVAVSALDFVEMSLPPREPIFGPIITRQSLAMLWAERGVGKTFIALNIAYAAATGGSFLKWQSPRAHNVLYLDGEMPAPDLQARVREIMARPNTHRLEGVHLRIVTPDLQTRTMPNIATDEGRHHVAELLDGVELVVVDNIATLCRVEEENSNDAWGPIQEWALDLRARGIAVLFVHHAGKSGQQRGGSSKEDVLDTVIKLSHAEDYDASEGAIFEWRFTKGRTLVGDEAESLEVWRDDVGGHAFWRWRPLMADAAAEVIEMKARGVSFREIAKALNITASKVQRILKKAERGQ